MRSLGGQMVCTACLGRASEGASKLWTDLQERMVNTKIDSRMRVAGVPAAFAAQSFETFRAPSPKAEKVVSVLRNYCGNFAISRNKRTGFIFIGPPGTAKTHLACSMVQALVLNGYTAAYASLPRLTLDIRAAFGRARAVDDILKNLIAVDFLVLDEIDLHGSSDNDYNMLYDIINSRYERTGFPTLAISNRQLERLHQDLDERVVSRLLAGTDPVVFDWPSQRDIRAQQNHARGGAL